MTIPETLTDRDRYAFIEDPLDGGVDRRVWVRGGTVSTNASATPVIYNLVATLANTEYSYVIPANTKKLLVRSRLSNAQLQFSFTSGQSGVSFITIPRGTTFSEDALLLTSLTIYIQSSLAANVVEVLTWS